MVLVYRMQVLKEVLRIISDMVYSIYLKFVLISGILTLFINIALIITKGHVTRGNFFLQLATQRRFKLPFTREITLLVCKIIRLQVIQQLAYVYNSTGACDIFFHPNLRCKLQKWFLYVRCFSGQISAWRFLIRSFFYAGCLLYKIEQIWLLVMYLF